MDYLGAEGAKAIAGRLAAAQERSREWQAAQLRRTGYATPQAELGHAIVQTLRELGYPLTVAHVGGQLGAVATAYNWQGNARIGEVIGRHKRTVQRARARLEADGLIRSELLLTGDLLDGQRAPVRHPQVVRDVSRLQRLARARDAMRAPDARQRRRKKRKGPSAAEVPRSDPTPMTAEDFRARAEAAPEFAAFFGEMADLAAKRGPQKPPPNAAHIDPSELADVEREIADVDRERDRQRERGPPERAPPERR